MTAPTSALGTGTVPGRMTSRRAFIADFSIAVDAHAARLGSPVRCADAPFGELADVVVDPIARRVTHLVVQPHHRHDLARLVPIDSVRAEETAIALDRTVAEVEALEPLQESAYVRAGELPVADPDWAIGIRDVFALALYLDLDGMQTTIAPDPDPHVIVNYDRIPREEVEIRRSSAVISADGHHLGHVDGFLVDADAPSPTSCSNAAISGAGARS